MLGIVFVAIVVLSPLRRYADSFAARVGFGLAYGVVTTIALAWVLLPIRLRAVGFAQAPTGS